LVVYFMYPCTACWCAVVYSRTNCRVQFRFRAKPQRVGKLGVQTPQNVATSLKSGENRSALDDDGDGPDARDARRVDGLVGRRPVGAVESTALRRRTRLSTLPLRLLPSRSPRRHREAHHAFPGLWLRARKFCKISCSAPSSATVRACTTRRCAPTTSWRRRARTTSTTLTRSKAWTASCTRSTARWRRRARSWPRRSTSSATT